MRPTPLGVTLMIEADGLEQASAMVKALPMVAEDLISAEILPLAPFTAYKTLFANAPAWG